MRPSILALRAAVCGIALLPAYAAPPAAIKDLAAYKAHMDEVEDIKEQLSEAIGAKNQKDAAALGSQLTTLLEQEDIFWQQQKLPTAIELSKTTLRLSKDVEQGIKQGDLPAAFESYKKLQVSCRTCHDAHPERQLH